MPLYLGDHPAGFVPAFGLILHINVFDLDAVLGRTANRSVQVAARYKSRYPTYRQKKTGLKSCDI
jgi:hypothetical protein